MNNMQKSFKQKAQLGMRAANPVQKMQLGATPHMGSGKPPRMASGLAQRFADGGRVHGMGGPTQDKVSAKLSPGEYVLPADTVAAVGAHNLDGLRAATHVPVAPNAPNHFANGGQPVDIDNITRQGNSYTGTGVATPAPATAPVVPATVPVAPVTASTSPIVRNGNSFSNVGSSPAPLAPTVPKPPVAPVVPAPVTPTPSAAPASVSNGQVGRSAGLIPAPVTPTPSAAPASVSNGQVGRSAGLIPAPSPSAAPATVSTVSSFLHGVDDVAPGNNKASGVGLTSAIHATGAWLAQQKANSDAEFSNNPALNNAGVINPWAEIPFVGPATVGAEAAADAAPGMVSKGIGVLKNATSWLGGKLPGAAARAADSAAATPIGNVITPLMAHDFVGPPTSAILTGMRAQAAQNAKAFVGPPTRGAINAAAGYAQRGVGTALRATAPQSLGAVEGSIPETGSTSKPTAAKAAPVAAAATPAVDPALAAQQAATKQANAALPAGLKDAQGNLNGDAIFAAQPGAVASAPIAAAQAQRVQSAMQQGLRAGSSPVSGDGTPIATTAPRYADPAAAEAYYRNRTESQLSPQGIAESNAFARAQTRGMNAGALARDNAAYASRGMNVTKSSDGKGGVLYSDAPNPYMNSTFAGGKTGNDIAATNAVNNATNLAAARQLQAEQAARSAAHDEQVERARLEGNIYSSNGATQRAAVDMYDQHLATQRDLVGIAERKDVAEKGLQASANYRAAEMAWNKHLDEVSQNHWNAAQDQQHQQFGATRHDIALKQNDDLIRAKHTVNGTLDSAGYNAEKQFTAQALAAHNLDIAAADPQYMNDTGLSYDASQVKPVFNGLRNLVGAGAPNSNTPQQARFVAKRPGAFGEQIQRADGTWVNRKDVNGAGFIGGNANAAIDAMIDRQIDEATKGGKG